MIPLRSSAAPTGNALTSSSPMSAAASWAVASGARNSTWRVMTSATLIRELHVCSGSKCDQTSSSGPHRPASARRQLPDERNRRHPDDQDHDGKGQAELPIIAEPVPSWPHDQRIALV